MASVFTGALFQAITLTGVVPGARVYIYEPGTLTPLASYTTEDASVANPHPIIADGNGQAAIWISAPSFRARVESPIGVVLTDDDNLSTAFSGADLADGAVATSGAGMVGFSYATAYGIGTLGKWLKDLGTSVGSGLIGFIQAGTGAVLRTLQTKARDTVNLKDFGAVFDGITDDTAAWAAALTYVKSIKGKLICPGGTSLVSKITLDGSNYSIDTTAGVTIKQTTGTDSTTGQMIVITGSNIVVGDLSFIGNIATDTLEYHHCVYIYDDAGVATIKNITLGNLYGTNIRGDVLYAGSPTSARPVTGIVYGVVSGNNVLRNLVTCTGAQMSGEAIIHDGPVGYRDFDVEPNAASTFPSDFRVKYVKAGIVQITSAESTLVSVVDIGTLDCDYSRIADTTPVYLGGLLPNAQALHVQYARYCHIGYFKARNYNYSPVTSSTSAIKSNVVIDVADIANCDITEAVYNSLFADQGTGGIAYLDIGVLLATLTATTKMVFNGNGMQVHVRRGTVVGGLLASNIPGGVYENMSIDMSGATGYALNSCTDSVLQKVSFSNAASATLMINGVSNILTNVFGIFSVIQASGCADNRAISCTLNGVKYPNDLLGGQQVATKPMLDANQTLSSLEAVAPIVITTDVLTAQRNLVVPSVPRIYSVFNNCTGFGVNVVGSTGTGTVVGVGKRALVQFDGVNVVRVTADL